jgi:Uma2 family endonuclease
MSIMDDVEVGMSLTDFLQESQQQPFEWINGEKKIKMATTAGHSEIIRALHRPLDAHCYHHKLGNVFIETTFILPNTYNRNWVLGSFIPDMMFFSASRLQAYKSDNPDWRTRPYALVPDWILEVISPNDTVGDLDSKINAYLEADVRLIWTVYLQTQKAIVYSPHQAQPLHLSPNDLLDGGTVLGDFRMTLKELFTGE